MTLRLDARLRAILNEICCDTLADIGCDHGKIAVGALLENRAAKAIAADISGASLNKCRILGDECGVSDRLDCRLGDGFAPIQEGEADLAVIAGMGGREIIKILSQTDYRGKLVIVPHQDTDKLRQYISGKYAVNKDFVINCRGKFYSIIVVSEGSYNYAQEDILFGPDMPHSQDYLDMLAYEKDKLSKIMDGGGAGEVANKYKEVQRLCQKYKI